LATIGIQRTNLGIFSLLFAGSVVGLNWLNFASIFPFVASDLNLNVTALGSITALFVIGAGSFQVPGALAAGRYGPKIMMIFGTLGASVSTLLVAFAGSVPEFEILRFSCAVSTAFAYAPGYTLITKYFSPGKEGSATGLFGAAAIFGNIIALAVDAVLPVYIGWRATIALNGILGLIAGLALMTLPTLPTAKETASELEESVLRVVKRTMLDKGMLVLCIVLTSLEIGIVIAGNFVIFYLESQLSVPPEIAGWVASLLPIVGVPASIFFGRLYDRNGKAKLLILVSGIAAASGLAIAAFGTPYSTALTSVLVGFGNNAGYIVAVALAGKMTINDKRFEVVGIAWILSVSLLASFFAPILFSTLATSSGYPMAWVGCGIVMLALLLPIIFVSTNKLENAVQKV
jgi:MFS family permease